MRKNKMMRLASFLFVAVLLTTSIISGTYAKYVTKGEVGDEARVAKFGVVVTGQGSLFGTDYWALDQDDSNKPGDPEKDHDTEKMVMTVESSNGDNLVAPGTKNPDGGMTIGITGTPEVDVRINVEAEDIKDVFLGVATGLPDMTTSEAGVVFDNLVEYHPILFNLRGAFVEANKAALQNAGLKAYKNYVAGTFEDIEKALDILFDTENGGLYVDANTDLAEKVGVLTLTWEWKFETELTDAEKTAISDAADAYWDAEMAKASDEFAAIKAQYGSKAKYVKAMVSAAEAVYHDRQDTLLGDLAAGTATTDADYSLDVSIKLTITVTQVD